MDLQLSSTILLTAAVLLGAYLVFTGVRQHRRLPSLGLVHAALALAATAVLFVHVFSGQSDKLDNAAALFLLFALIGGGLVFALHQEGRPPSMAAVTAHAVMGLIALCLLLINIP